jgi:hypothetical protein
LKFGLWSLVLGLWTLCLVLCAWINIRLEVGPAHRCDLGEIMRVSNEPMIIEPTGLGHVASVGDAHL